MQDTYVNERERERIPDKYKWDLSAIYADDDAWEIAKQQFEASFPQISAFAERLSESPEKRTIGMPEIPY
jgi:oligoendopeptidase F